VLSANAPLSGEFLAMLDMVVSWLVDLSRSSACCSSPPIQKRFEARRVASARRHGQRRVP